MQARFGGGDTIPTPLRRAASPPIVELVASRRRASTPQTPHIPPTTNPHPIAAFPTVERQKGTLMPSNRFKLTDRFVASLPAHDPNSRSTQREYADSECIGLRITVSKSGRRFWDYRYMLSNRKRILRIGEFPGMQTADARKKAWELRGAIAAGNDPSVAVENRRSMPTLEQYAATYIEYAKRTIRSWGNCEGHLRNRILPAMGRRLLSDIRRADLDKLYLNTLDEVSVASANRVMATLKALLGHAVRSEVIERSPGERFRLRKENNARTRSLSPDEVRRYLAALDEEPNVYLRALLRLLLSTGMRRGEAMGAKWEQVDLEKRTFYLPRTKGGRAKTVLLNESACAILRDLKPVAGNPHVFPGSRPGMPITEPKFAHERACKKAGIKDLKIHDLRHSFASLAVSNGASLYTVQGLLGHASPIMSQRYSHLNNESLRAGSGIVSNIIEAASKQADDQEPPPPLEKTD
ncbi:tyrosine-type recombinase/integrase [bacterium]|nr:tyrosine-type recombinase/integrase [bacterium]